MTLRSSCPWHLHNSPLAAQGARFGGAQLATADFRGANLQGAREMTPEQLMLCLTDQTTTLPNGKKRVFQGFVKQFTEQGGVDQVVKGSAVIRITGAVNFG